MAVGKYKKTVATRSLLCFWATSEFGISQTTAWVDGPNKRMTWDEAKSWVANLTVAGGGWHMPTRKELKTLYQKGAGTENRTPLFKNNNCGVWSGETKGSSWAYFFNFCNGKTYWELCGSHRDLYSRGVTAVRSRK